MRYTRQIGLIGREGQQKLAKARVAVIGLGGLGSAVAQLLCRAGVGTLHLYDNDKVSLTNLHRQILYHEGDIGKPKVVLAKEKLTKMNVSANVQSHLLRIDGKSIKKLPVLDLLIDCTDNLAARRAINAYCVQKKLPWVHGAVDGEQGIVAVFVPGGACYGCIMKGKKDSDRKQILGTYPAVVGGLQASMVIKLLIGKPVAEMISISFKDMEMKKMKLTRAADCRY